MKNGSNRDSLIKTDELDLDFLDKEKIGLFSRDITIGIKNYILFQKFFYYNWPCWIYSSFHNNSKSSHLTAPILLLNNCNRNWISFSNLNSSEKIIIDPSGMISPSYDDWSLEFWIYEKGQLLRPQERSSKVSQARDTKSMTINTKWKERNFDLVEQVYGTKTSIEEAVIEINCNVSKKLEPLSLLVVVRPYNTISISGIEKIEYKSDSKIIKINDRDRILIDSKPGFVLTGNEPHGDIEIDDRGEDKHKSSCKYKMATLALGYSLPKGANEFKIRLSLSKDEDIVADKIDFSKSKKSYINSSNSRMQKGFKLKFPDAGFQNWFHGSKIPALNYFNKDNIGITEWHKHDMKSIYYITCGYNRMGFFAESLKIIDSAISGFTIKGKASFAKHTDGCYVINFIADHFMISRDIDYLKSKYKSIKEIALALYKEASQYKKGEIGHKEKKNSIDSFIILEHHLFDLILLSFSLRQFSYLARCLGIFDDEIKFNKMSDILESIILKDIECNFDENKNLSDDSDDDYDETSDTNFKKEMNELFIYKIFAGYPFSMNSLGTDNLKTIINKITKHFSGIPLYIKSIGGGDILLSIIFTTNLLITKDPRAQDFLKKLMDIGKKRYALPDIVNIQTGLGIMGEGDSVIATSAIFTLLRNSLFLDMDDKLDIFPVPFEKWFQEGAEIKIEDAPSKFGLLNFSVVTTKKEVQFYFNKLPQYVPPNIMLNLPFKAKIKQEDDFIVKKRIGNSYLINGWPSKIRFIKQ